MLNWFKILQPKSIRNLKKFYNIDHWNSLKIFCRISYPFSKLTCRKVYNEKVDQKLPLGWVGRSRIWAILKYFSNENGVPLRMGVFSDLKVETKSCCHVDVKIVEGVMKSSQNLWTLKIINKIHIHFDPCQSSIS